MGSKPRGISASRGAAVLGVSEYQTPFEVWQRIMEEREPGFNQAHGYVLPPEPDSAAMRWGSAFENAVIALAEMASEKNIIHRERFDAAPSMDYVTCHLDGAYDNTDCLIHEGKTTSAMTFREKWGTPGTGHIPRIYQVQVQHQMLCSGASEAIVSVLVFPETPDKWEAMGWVIDEGMDGTYMLTRNCGGNYTDTLEWARVLSEMGYFHQYPIARNTESQRLMVNAYRDFWHNHVLAGKPPEPRNYEDIKRLFPEPKSTIIVPDYIERKMMEYKGINEETASAKKRKERIKMIATKYAATHTGIEDDESTEAVIFRNGSGDKLGSWSRNKNGALVFRC